MKGETGKASSGPTEEAWRDAYKRRGKASATVDVGQVLSHAHVSAVQQYCPAVLQNFMAHITEVRRVLYCTVLYCTATWFR